MLSWIAIGAAMLACDIAGQYLDPRLLETGGRAPKIEVNAAIRRASLFWSIKIIFGVGGWAVLGYGLAGWAGVAIALGSLFVLLTCLLLNETPGRKIHPVTLKALTAEFSARALIVGFAFSILFLAR